MKPEIRIEGDRLEISRLFDAPQQMVFDAWKQADKIQQWWGCHSTSLVESDIDFRVGGHFRHKMQIEGCGEYEYAAVFDEILEPERIAYTAQFPDHTERVTVQFHAQGEGTRLILTQVGFPDPKFCQIVSEGFTSAFEKLHRLLTVSRV